MSKRTKEKVLRYLLERKRDSEGCVYLALGSYSAIPKVTPELFIEQLRVLEYEKLLACKYIGNPSATSPCYVTIFPPALTYFTDKRIRTTKKIFGGWIDLIKFLIPVIISAAALLVSILAYLK